MVSTIESGAGSVGDSARPTLPKTLFTSGNAREDRVLPLELALRLLDREVRQRRRHVEDVALVERRHELVAELQDERDRREQREHADERAWSSGRRSAT